MAIQSWMTAFQNRLQRQFSAKRRGVKRRASSVVAAQMEDLEQRTLLTTAVQFFAGDLIVFADANESITLDTTGLGGQVQLRINNVVDQSLPALLPGSVTGIQIFAGSGENRVDVSGVTAADFTALVSLVVDGGNGDDTITGSVDFPTEIFGGDGDDLIVGGNAADVIDGGDGNDMISGGDGNDVIDAGDGDDAVNGGLGDDVISAGDGQDTVHGDDGDDTISGGDGTDSLLGEDGDDEIHGDHGNDLLFGGNGGDRMFGGADNDHMEGEAGDDNIFGGGGDDTLSGGDGQDRVEGKTGNDLIDGGTGDDTLRGDHDNDTIFGQDGNDFIFGGGGDDTVDGNLGDDTILGNSGDDTLCGGLGFDSIEGGNGDDLIMSVCEPVAPIGISIGDLNVSEGSEADVVIVIDISGSTGQPFFGTPVGDINGDGASDTILDVELASVLAFHQDLLMRGVTASLSVVSFDDSSTIEDMDPTLPGVQIATTPTADTDGNGVFDFVQVVRSLQVGGATAFEPALQNALSVFQQLGTALGSGTLVFLSDGVPFLDGLPNFNPPLFVDEVAALTTLGVTRRAFLVDDGFQQPEALMNMQVIDQNAISVTSSDQLAMELGNLGVTAQQSFVDIVLGVAPPVPFTVDYTLTAGTATAGVDYVDISGKVQFAAGQTTATIPVQITSDTVMEGPETFFLTLSNLQTLQFTITPFILVDPTALITIYDTGAVVPPSPPPAPPIDLGNVVRGFDFDADTLSGGTGNDTILGDAGNDILAGDHDNDLLDGGIGNDTIRGGAGDDTLFGAEGNDQLRGQGGLDVLHGGSGEDELQWNGAGNDTLIGDTGADSASIDTGSGSQTLSIGQNGDGQMTFTNAGRTLTIDGTLNYVTLSGGSGNDSITVGDLSSVEPTILVVEGGRNNDRIDASGMIPGRVRVRLSGGDGNDTITGSAFNDTISGGNDDDLVNAGAGNDTVSGDAGFDVLNGQDGNDIIDGGDDNDVVNGGNGNDTLIGGFGNDTLEGEDGDDSVTGGFGDDSLTGSFGNDTLDGGNGFDFIRGGAGDDFIDGGRNDDTINANGGNDTINGNHGNDSIRGGAGDDEIVGGDGDDTIRGEDGVDSIAGNDGNDHLSGDAGDDLITGGDGDDTLRGGAQNDTLIGNEGADSINGNGDNSGQPNREIAVPGEGGDPTPKDVDAVLTEEEAFTPQLLAVLALLDGKP